MLAIQLGERQEDERGAAHTGPGVDKDVPQTNMNASSPKEEEAIEATTMEKMQGMHLEIAELKRLNRELKKRMLRYLVVRNFKEEVSHMTGIIQRTTTTSITYSPTAKPMKAMAGFVTAHVMDGRQDGEDEDESQSRPMDPPDDVVVTVDDATPKAPPQLILTSTAKYNRNLNVDQAHGSRLHKQQQSTS